ncbi:MAG: hypothetical protein ACI9R3_006295, partial [Verrucomicrobiales bacterium]
MGRAELGMEGVELHRAQRCNVQFLECAGLDSTFRHETRYS